CGTRGKVRGPGIRKCSRRRELSGCACARAAVASVASCSLRWGEPRWRQDSVKWLGPIESHTVWPLKLRVGGIGSHYLFEHTLRKIDVLSAKRIVPVKLVMVQAQSASE